MYISREAAQLEIEFNIPAVNVFGFEHAAKNEAQQQIIKDSFEKFDKVATIMTIQPECSTREIEYEKEHHTHADHEQEPMAEHSDVEIEYSMECPENKPLTIDFTIFSSFPSLREINVKFISSDSVELFNVTPQNPTINVN